MGKIFTRIMPGIGKATNNGIDFDILSKVLFCLPATTTVVKIDQDPGSFSFLVEAENPYFSNGTEIVGNWTRGYQIEPNTGLSVFYDIFKGVTVIDPPAQAQQNVLVSNGSSGSVTFSMPNVGVNPNYIIPNVAGKITSVWNPVTGIISIKDDSGSASTSCVCGAASVGGVHSSYCSKK